MFNDKTDKDRNDHEYVLSGTGVNVEPTGVFHINKDTGEVFVSRPVDREKTPFFHVNLWLYININIKKMYVIVFHK